ncbi:hypothetical protein MPAR168_21165 [Methylorubrum populi]|uniref:Uncharacterized protein n=1 Tax=Methylobacterium radiotolerans TaxID=31998 RepID=A0ABU7T565_9HYPH
MTPSHTNPTPPTKRPAPAQRDRQAAGSVVPFVGSGARRFRRDEDDAPRGQVLLFTGVRYERLPDADAAPVPQRRRS